MATTEDPGTLNAARAAFRRRRWRGRVVRWRPWLIVALVLTLVGTGIWVVFSSSLAEVRRVEVSGNSTLSAVRVRAAARAPRGEPLARVDLDAIRERVEAIPSVERAEVSRGWPHAVRIQITERTPLAVVNRGGGLQALDGEGVLFGSYPRPPRNLPLVVTPADIGSDALVEAARVVVALRADIAARVGRVEVDTIDEIRLRLKDGRLVLWGSASASQEKAEVLAVLLKRGARVIDVSVPSRPTTR